MSNIHETETLTPNAKHLGHDLKGKDLTDFMTDSATQIRQAWKMVYQDAEGQMLTLDEYKRATFLGFFAVNVRIAAYQWLTSDVEEQRAIGTDILTHQILKYSLTAIEAVKNKYPNLNLDDLDLLQEGFIIGWRIKDKYPGDELLAARINRQIIEGSATQNAIRVACLQTEETPTRDELENASFIGTNMDEIIDPPKRVENADKSFQVRWHVGKLDPRLKDIVNQRFPQADAKPATQQEIGDQYCVTKGRIFQLEEAAIRKLKSKLRSYAADLG